MKNFFKKDKKYLICPYCFNPIKKDHIVLQEQSNIAEHGSFYHARCLVFLYKLNWLRRKE